MAESSVQRTGLTSSASSISPTLSASPTSSARRRFSDDFKRDAVRLVVQESYSFKAAAQAVGVCEKSLRDWHHKSAPAREACPDNAYPGVILQPRWPPFACNNWIPFS